MTKAKSNETRLYVLNGQQKKALNKGAKFVRKDFFRKGSEGYFVVSNGEGMTDEKKDKLLSEFGEGVFEGRNERKMIDEEWRRTLKEGDNLDALRLAKEKGMPESPDILKQLFRKWRTDNPDEYRLNWKCLCDYLPNFDKRFGKNAFLSLCNEYGLIGDMDAAIEHAKGGGMQDYEAEYLHFCYSHRLPGGKEDCNRMVMGG